jgi:hypothetical protein
MEEMNNKQTTAATTATVPLFGAAEAARANKTVREFIAVTFPQEGAAPVKTGSAGRSISKTWQTYCDDINATLPIHVQKFLNTPALIAAFADARSAGRRALTAEEADAIANGRDCKGVPSKRKSDKYRKQSKAKDLPCMGTRNGEPWQIDLHLSEKFGTRQSEKSLGMTYRRRYAQFARRAQESANEYNCPVRLLLIMFCAERNLRNEATAEKYGMPLSAVGLPSLWNGEILITNRLDKWFDGQVGDPGVFVPEVAE